MVIACYELPLSVGANDASEAVIMSVENKHGFIVKKGPNPKTILAVLSEKAEADIPLINIETGPCCPPVIKETHHRPFFHRIDANTAYRIPLLEER